MRIRPHRRACRLARALRPRGPRAGRVRERHAGLRRRHRRRPAGAEDARRRSRGDRGRLLARGRARLARRVGRRHADPLQRAARVRPPRDRVLPVAGRRRCERDRKRAPVRPADPRHRRARAGREGASRGGVALPEAGRGHAGRHLRELARGARDLYQPPHRARPRLPAGGLGARRRDAVLADPAPGRPRVGRGPVGAVPGGPYRLRGGVPPPRLRRAHGLGARPHRAGVRARRHAALPPGLPARHHRAQVRRGAAGPPRLPRSADRPSEPGDVQRAPRAGARPGAADGVGCGRALHRSRRLQARERQLRPFGRRRASAPGRRPARVGHARRRPRRAAGRRRVPRPDRRLRRPPGRARVDAHGLRPDRPQGAFGAACPVHGRRHRTAHERVNWHLDVPGRRRRRRGHAEERRHRHVQGQGVRA